MIIGARLLKVIVLTLSIVGSSQAARATSASSLTFVAGGVAIGQDGRPLPDTSVKEISKSDFLEKLDGQQNMLLNFYETGNEESDKVLKEFEAFAERAATRYPGLYLGKVDFKENPYLTARMLLTGIPELRLLVRDQAGKWSAYNPEISEGADELIEYMDNQHWYSAEPVGSKRQLYCSPFNFCGKLLAVIADKGSIVDRYIPLPKWLALIVIPALFTFAGRFIIEGMYAAEDRVRGFFRRNRDEGTDAHRTDIPAAPAAEAQKPEGKKTR
ncbi:hypothetical protein BX070DRAFT_220579 [Coemansia spiralis]|nr:hypothetical protein BX070DRAFT_220579 [Coemansia spiralis]